MWPWAIPCSLSFTRQTIQSPERNSAVLACVRITLGFSFVCVFDGTEQYADGEGGGCVAYEYTGKNKTGFWSTTQWVNDTSQVCICMF